MTDICPKCGLPVEICACKAIEREKGGAIVISTTKRKFGKIVTVISGLPSDVLSQTAKELKTKLACGGSAKDGEVVLQGRHTEKVRDLLVKMGYPRENIVLK